MKEQSHKSEMRAALRGDFERLRARRHGEPAPIEPPSAPSVAEADREPEAAPAPVVEDARGGSWRDRLRGRG